MIGAQKSALSTLRKSMLTPDAPQCAQQCRKAVKAQEICVYGAYTAHRQAFD